MSEAALLASHEGLPTTFGLYNHETNNLYANIGINVASIQDIATGKFDVLMTSNYSSTDTIACQIMSNRDTGAAFTRIANGPDLNNRTLTTGNFPFVVGYVGSSSSILSDQQRLSFTLVGPLA